MYWVLKLFLLIKDKFILLKLYLQQISRMMVKFVTQ